MPEGLDQQAQAWSSLNPHFWPFSTVVWPLLPRRRGSDPRPRSSAGSASPWGAEARGHRDKPPPCCGWGWLLPGHGGPQKHLGARGPPGRVAALRVPRASVCSAGHLQRPHTCVLAPGGLAGSRPPRRAWPGLARRWQSSQPERGHMGWAGCAGRSGASRARHDGGPAEHRGEPMALG